MQIYSDWIGTSHYKATLEHGRTRAHLMHASRFISNERTSLHIFVIHNHYITFHFALIRQKGSITCIKIRIAFQITNCCFNSVNCVPSFVCWLRLIELFHDRARFKRLKSSVDTNATGTITRRWRWNWNQRFSVLWVLSGNNYNIKSSSAYENESFKLYLV